MNKIMHMTFLERGVVCEEVDTSNQLRKMKRTFIIIESILLDYHMKGRNILVLNSRPIVRPDRKEEIY